jgi:SAM-dependent methyltransferase
MENEYQNVALFLQAAMSKLGGLEHPSQTKVLDIGCGRGNLVNCLNTLGYDAYGCDIKPYWQEESNTDVGRFFTISSHPYRLPFGNKSFDAAVSTSVLEHAQNKEEIFQEIFRLLKNGGFSMHLLPGKWYLPTEPHIFVPLANFFWPKCPKWWFVLWAFLGVRNRFQINKSWKEVVRLNHEYCKHGLSYWSNGKYRKLSMQVFGNYSAPMEFYITDGYGGVANLLRKLPFKRLTGLLAGEVRMNFIVQRKMSKSMHSSAGTAPNKE